MAGHTPWRCRRNGHDWFPPIQQREFIVWASKCLRCEGEHVELPWGQCLGGHPMALHYTSNGTPVKLSTCPGPR